MNICAVSSGKPEGHRSSIRKNLWSFFILASLVLTARAEPVTMVVNVDSAEPKLLAATQETWRLFADLLGKALQVKVVAKPLVASAIKTAINEKRYPLLLIHTNDAAEGIKSKRYEAIGFSQDLGDNRILFFAHAGSSAKSLADVAGRCVEATDPGTMAAGEAILKKEKLFGKVKSYSYVRESEVLESHLKEKLCEIGVVRSSALAQKLVAAGNKQIYRSPEYPVFVMLANKDSGALVIEKLRKFVVEYEPPADTPFMKKTGIIRFETNMQGAIDLLDFY